VLSGSQQHIQLPLLLFQTGQQSKHGLLVRFVSLPGEGKIRFVHKEDRKPVALRCDGNECLGSFSSRLGLLAHFCRENELEQFTENWNAAKEFNKTNDRLRTTVLLNSRRTPAHIPVVSCSSRSAMA
jgi:hypothetical protein